VLLVLLQLLLGQRKGSFTDQRGNGDLNPVRTWPFVAGAIAAGQAAPLPQQPRDAPARTQLGFAIARPATVCRVAQHAPDRRALPTRGRRPGRNLPLIQQARNRVDAQALPRVRLKHQPHNGGFRLEDLVVGRRGVILPHIPIPVGSARQDVDRSLPCTMTLAAARPLGNLRPLVLCDHALELEQQLIFGRRTRGRLQEDEFHAVAGQLFGQQDLVGILAAEPVG
jgi:hypothetical protein